MAIKVKQYSYECIHTGLIISFYIYPTLKSCFETYTEGKLKKDELWEYEDSDGTLHKISQGLHLKRARAARCWGWASYDASIHLWYTKDVDKVSLIQLIAHERGHLYGPKHRDANIEERKANRYEAVAGFAYSIADELLNKEK